MFRYDVYTEIGGYPNVVTEDFLYFSDIIFKFKGSNLREVLVAYRLHESNYSITKKKLIDEFVYQRARQNFQSIVGNDRGFDVFFDYQQKKILRIKNILFIIDANNRIIKSIRDRYKAGSFDIGLLQLRIIICLGMIKILAKNIIT